MTLKEGYRRAGILYQHRFASEKDARCREVLNAVDPPQTMYTDVIGRDHSDGSHGHGLLADAAVPGVQRS